MPDDFRLKGIFRNIFSGRWARRDISELRYIYDLISLTSALALYINCNTIIAIIIIIWNEEINTGLHM